MDKVVKLLSMLVSKEITKGILFLMFWYNSEYWYIVILSLGFVICIVVVVVWWWVFRKNKE